MKSKDIPHISPQVAMDDYFKDMFGQENEDPLKKLEAQEQATQQQKSVAHQTETTKTYHARPEPKQLSAALAVTDFAAPEVTKGGISPLIIPAAFPKLAPPAIKTATKIKTETKKPVAEKQLVSQKIDKKTALAILLKQKSSLSKAQRLRLKEKLKQLEQKKQLEKASTLAKVPQQVQEPASEIKESVKIKAPVEAPVPKTEIKTITSTSAESEQASRFVEQSSPAVPKMNRPEWTERRFECLLFSVAGLKLAVPLMSLGAIYKIEKEFTPLVGRAKWFMGLYHHLDRNVRVVDTAQWVVPERGNQQVRESYKFIIRLGDSDWGMACDAVHQSIQLYPDQVKWRSERTKRVWLYGTVIDHMCALIDADALNALLEQQAPINISH